MSKKCCGIIYSDDEKVCKVCGKPLDEAEEVSDEQTSEQVDDLSDDSNDNKIKSDVEIDEEDSDIDIASEDSDVETKDIEAETESDTEEEDNVKKQITRDAILEQIYDEDSGYKKNDIIKDDKERTPFKTLGIFSLLIAFAGLALIGVLAYFIILNPYYIKSGASDEPLIYPELSTGSDAQDKSEPLISYQATETDAESVTEE